MIHTCIIFRDLMDNKFQGIECFLPFKYLKIIRITLTYKIGQTLARILILLMVTSGNESMLMNYIKTIRRAGLGKKDLSCC